MVIIILATVMVLGIAFYQVIQGLFSALIMTILTVLCAAVAMGYYEPLASAVLYTRQAETADAVALIALFVLPLLGLRMLVDRLIPGNVVFGRWADRIGGGVLGIFSGLIITGVLMVALQMLPFGASVLGYTPFDDALQRDQSLAPRRLEPRHTFHRPNHAPSCYRFQKSVELMAPEVLVFELLT